jgi:hypothetical protein
MFQAVFRLDDRPPGVIVPILDPAGSIGVFFQKFAGIKKILRDLVVVRVEGENGVTDSIQLDDLSIPEPVRSEFAFQTMVAVWPRALVSVSFSFCIRQPIDKSTG